MAKVICKEEYRGWKIELHQDELGSLKFSCFAPDGKNMDNFKRVNMNYSSHMKKAALQDAREFIDRLITETL